MGWYSFYQSIKDTQLKFVAKQDLLMIDLLPDQEQYCLPGISGLHLCADVFCGEKMDKIAKSTPQNTVCVGSMS